jgi:hypothetical protein
VYIVLSNIFRNLSIGMQYGCSAQQFYSSGSMDEQKWSHPDCFHPHPESGCLDCKCPWFSLLSARECLDRRYNRPCLSFTFFWSHHSRTLRHLCSQRTPLTLQERDTWSPAWHTDRLKNRRYKFRLHQTRNETLTAASYLLIITNSLAFSPQAKYTDWLTATCRRNLVPTFADRWGVAWSARPIPHGRYLILLDRTSPLHLHTITKRKQRIRRMNVSGF